MVFRSLLVVFLLLSIMNTAFGKDDSDANEGEDSVCGATIESFYRVKIELYDVTAECQQEDYDNMGVLIQGMVSEIDESIPVYQDEWMKTNMCEDTTKQGNTEKRFLRFDESHRNLGKYARRYLGAGRCRRCQKDNLDESGQGRSLIWSKSNWEKTVDYWSSKKDNDNNNDNKNSGENNNKGDSNNSSHWSSWFKKDVCTQAEKAVFMSDIAQNATVDATEVMSEMTSIAEDHGDNEDTIDDFLGRAQEEQNVVMKELEIALTAAEVATISCEKDSNATLKAEKDMYLDRADDAYDAAKDASKHVREALSRLKDIRIEMKEAVYKPDLDVVSSASATATMEEAAELSEVMEELNEAVDELAEEVVGLDEVADMETEAKIEKVKEVIESQEATLQAELDAVNADIEELDRRIKKEKRGKKKKKYKEKRDKLKIEAAKIEENLALGTKILSVEAQWEADVARLRLAVEGADTISEWCEKFSELLLLEIPVRLAREYNSTGIGCLSGPPGVTAEMIEELEPQEGLCEQPGNDPRL